MEEPTDEILLPDRAFIILGEDSFFHFTPFRIAITNIAAKPKECLYKKINVEDILFISFNQYEGDNKNFFTLRMITRTEEDEINTTITISFEAKDFPMFQRKVVPVLKEMYVFLKDKLKVRNFDCCRFVLVLIGNYLFNRVFPEDTFMYSQNAIIRAKTFFVIEDLFIPKFEYSESVEASPEKKSIVLSPDDTLGRVCEVLHTLETLFKKVN